MPDRLVNTRNSRLARCQTYFELTVYEAVQKEAAKQNLSTSNYIRGVMIEHLVETGILDKDQVIKLLLVSA